MELYFKKENGRYKKLGEQWNGFPAEGWWFVGNGRQNLVVPVEEPRPLEKLQYLQFQNEITDRLFKDGTMNNVSFQDLVGMVLSELEEILEEKS